MSTIAVVLPTLGRRLGHLRVSLESIEAQRAEGSKIRLIAVVPKSAEEARRLISQYGGELIDDTESGMSAAMNLGLNAAGSEEYYAWMSDSDFYLPAALSRLMKVLDDDTSAVVAFGNCRFITEEDSLIGVSRGGKFASRILSWGPNLIPHPGALMRLKSVRSIGGYDPDLRYAMDLDLFLKLKTQGQFVFINHAVCAFRIHDDSVSMSDKTASFQEARGVRRRHLAPWLRPLSGIWETAWRAQSAIASKREMKRIRNST